MTAHINKDSFYRSLFEYNPEIALYLDREGVIAKANQNLSKLIGYKVEEVSITPLIKYLPKHEQDNYQKNFLEVLNGEPKSMDSFFIHNNGKSIPIQIVLIPAIVEDKVTGAFGIIIDKSEEQKIKSKLIESEAKFRGIVEEALVGVFILKGKYLLYGNPYYHQLIGTKYPDANFNVLNYVHPEDSKEVESTFDSLKDGEQGITHYARVIRQDGSQTKHILN